MTEPEPEAQGHFSSGRRISFSWQSHGSCFLMIVPSAACSASTSTFSLSLEDRAAVTWTTEEDEGEEEPEEEPEENEEEEPEEELEEELEEPEWDSS